MRERFVSAEIRSALTGQRRPGAGADAATKSDNALTLELPTSLADAERHIVLATLERLGGDKQRTAETLGISVKTLYSRLREYAGRAADS